MVDGPADHRGHHRLAAHPDDAEAHAADQRAPLTPGQPPQERARASCAPPSRDGREGGGALAPRYGADRVAERLVIAVDGVSSSSPVTDSSIPQEARAKSIALAAPVGLIRSVIWPGSPSRCSPILNAVAPPDSAKAWASQRVGFSGRSMRCGGWSPVIVHVGPPHVGADRREHRGPGDGVDGQRRPGGAGGLHDQGEGAVGALAAVAVGRHVVVPAQRRDLADRDLEAARRGVAADHVGLVLDRDGDHLVAVLDGDLCRSSRRSRRPAARAGRSGSRARTARGCRAAGCRAASVRNRPSE